MIFFPDYIVIFYLKKANDVFVDYVDEINVPGHGIFKKYPLKERNYAPAINGKNSAFINNNFSIKDILTELAECFKLELSIENYKIVLFSRPDFNIPFLLSDFKSNDETGRIHIVNFVEALRNLFRINVA